MEKEGFKRSVHFLKNGTFGFSIQTIITDRHSQIIKYVREEMPDTEHCFDVWLVAKSE